MLLVPPLENRNVQRRIAVNFASDVMEET